MRHRGGRDIGEDTELLKLLQRCPVLQGTDGPLCRGYRLSYNNAAMDGTDIFQAVNQGEDSRNQFKRDIRNPDSLAAETVHSDYFGGFTVSDIDLPYFKEFFQKRYGEELESRNLPIERIIDNMKLGHGGDLNLTGALLCGTCRMGGTLTVSVNWRFRVLFSRNFW